MSKRLLQFINALVAIMTIVLASMSLLFGVNSPVYNEAINTEIPALTATFDSSVDWVWG